MVDQASKAELMRSLGYLVRGLSALFWGLPLALITCVQTGSARYLWFGPVGFIAPTIALALLFYGLLHLSRFQKQERVWQAAVERAKIVALVNVGLSPFLYWWQKLPEVGLFENMVYFFAFLGIFFLFNLNVLLRRLAAMLPDETVRIETRLFTTLNLYLLVLIPVLAIAYYLVGWLAPGTVVDWILLTGAMPQWILLFLLLLPLAMTMALIWKTKELILHSLFHN